MELVFLGILDDSSFIHLVVPSEALQQKLEKPGTLRASLAFFDCYESDIQHMPFFRIESIFGQMASA